MSMMSMIMSTTTAQQRERCGKKPNHMAIFVAALIQHDASQGYSGVAIYSKFKPIRVHHGIGIEEHDNEGSSPTQRSRPRYVTDLMFTTGRCITLEFAKFFLVGTYIPNSGDELRRLEYRQKWNRDLEAYLHELATSGLKGGIDIDEKSSGGNLRLECTRAGERC